METIKTTILFISLTLCVFSCQTPLEEIAVEEEVVDDQETPADEQQNTAPTVVESLSSIKAEIVMDPAELNQRVTPTQQEVNISLNGRVSGRVVNDIRLELISEMAPPVVNGKTVMATSVSNVNNRIAVSYNTAGAAYSGAVVLMTLQDDELSIDSQITFAESDVSSVVLKEDYLYLAGATALSDRPAWVSKFRVSDNMIQESGIYQTFLGGFVSTSIAVSDRAIFATSGTGISFGGGVYQLDILDLSESRYVPLADARWVMTQDDESIVQNGSPAEMITVRNGNAVSSFNYKAPTVDSKASFDIVGDYLFVAAGQNGVQIHHKETGVLAGEIPLPRGGSADLNTNSVAVYGDLIFVSNGEGVYVCTYSDDDEPAPEIIGKLELGSFASVNHVTFIDNKLILASGLGGVKVISLEVATPAPTIEGDLLDKSGWRVIYTDSEEASLGRWASNLIDGNPNTFWHTEWRNSNPAHPHEVQIDLGAEHWMTEFRYLARQDYPTMFNGSIKDFELYFSDDGSEWGEPFYVGSFEKTKAEQIITFEFESVKGRYLRMVSLSEVNGNPWASGAEINIFGAAVN